MTMRYFVQEIEVSEDAPDDFQPEGNVVDSTEITEEHYETIDKDRDAIERGFDGRWHETFITLVQALRQLKPIIGRMQRRQEIRTLSKSCSVGS